YSAVILHDIGKLQELDTDATGVAEYTVDGNLFGHTLLAIEMIDRKNFENPTYPAEKIRLLKHCIAAHHGQLEYGAITMPAVREAMLLHEIDVIDASMYQYEQAEKTLNPGEMSDRIFGLGVKVYKPAANAEEKANV
ncbi:HD domain-containing protein, partial [Fusicatenibacter saccharivorans]